MMDQYGHKAQLCDALEIPYTKHQPTDADLIANFAATIKKFWGDDFGASCFYDSGTRPILIRRAARRPHGSSILDHCQADCLWSSGTLWNFVGFLFLVYLCCLR